MIWRMLGVLDRHTMRRRGGAHLNTLSLYGSYRCRHRSHALRLRCLRYWASDAYCWKHNNSCWDGCS